MLLCLGSYAQRIPNKNGITHHTITEDKIQLMKNCNLAQEKIIKYQKSIIENIGLCVFGGSIMYVAAEQLPIPVKFNDGTKGKNYKSRKNLRKYTGILGAGIFGYGVYRLCRNWRLLNKAKLNLRPTNGGIKFVF